MAYHYDPDNKFGYKDTLPEDHPEKVITGVEFDDEFKKIAGAFAIFDPDGDGDISIDNIDGLQDALDKERQERIEADADLQGQIDALDPDGDRNVGWDEIENKPTEFPPAAHNQDWNTITNTPSEYPPEAHTHEQGDIDGLEDRLESIEDSITSGGGFVDAPNDGQLYGRQSEAWAVVPSGGASSWDDLTDKPTEFPPAAHNQGWDTITDKPDDYPPSAHGHAWDEITGKPTDFPPASHNHDGVYQPVGDYIEDANSDGKQYARQDGAWSEIVIPDGGTGSSVHIGDTPPVDPQEGQQWMEVPASGDATMWIYDGAKWLEQPGGKDGADGTDGVDGLWTDNGDGSISYKDVDVKGDSSLSAGGATFSGTIGHVPADNISGYLYSYDGAVLFQALNAGDSSAVPFEIWTGTDKRFVVGADGNVAIGNHEIRPDGGIFSKFDSGSTSDIHLGAVVGTSNGFQILKAANNEVTYKFTSSGTEKFIIEPNGDVGIGTNGVGTTSGLNIYPDGNIAWKESSDGSVANIFRQASSGALVLAQGYKQTATPNGFASSQAGNFAKSAITVANGINFYVDNYTDISVGSDVNPTKQMSIDYNGRVDITGSLYVNGTPKIGTVDMIKAFSKLRDAVKDEETVESLKESITNCIGGLIEEWESMQSPATQEIDS